MRLLESIGESLSEPPALEVRMLVYRRIRMTEYKISKRIQIPDRKRGRPHKYPFAQMEIGDSFDAKRVAAWSAMGYGKRHDMEFAERKIGKNKIRIWRVQ